MIESEEKSLINEIGKEQIIKWCSFLPRKELILLLRKIFSENENRVKILYTSKINKRINPKSNFFDYLFNRGVTDIIIEIISENSDPSTEQKIKELFLEYKYGSKPSFYFLTLEKPLTYTEIVKNESEIKKYLKFKNQEIDLNKYPSIKNIRLNKIEKSDDSIIIIQILFDLKITYIKTDTLEPGIIYTHEDSIIIIKEDLEYFSIKTKTGKINRFLKDMIKETFGIIVKGIQLQQEIVNFLFDEKTINSATFSGGLRSERTAKVITLTDGDLSSLPEYNNLKKKRDRKRSSHKLKFLDTDNYVVISKDGNLYINGLFKISDIKLEIIHILINLSKYLSNLRKNNSLIYFKSMNPLDIEFLNQFQYSEQKKLFHELTISILDLKISDVSYKLHDFDISRCSYYLADLFISEIEIACEVPECNGRIKCPICENPIFGVINLKPDKTIICEKCQNKLDINNIPELDCDHENNFSIETKIRLILTSSGKFLINQYLNYQELTIHVNQNEYIELNNSAIIIKKSIFNSIIPIESIPYFERLPKLDILTSNEKENYKNIVIKRLKEKCKFYNSNNCRSCLNNYFGNCVQRTIINFTGGTLRAHSPIEFGDFNFDLLVEGENVRVVGLAKSYNNSVNTKDKKNIKKTDIITRSSDKGLIGQVLDAIYFKKARCIMIASTALINEDFKTLVEIQCQENSVYLIYFEQEHFIRAMKPYIEDMKSKFGSYKSIYLSKDIELTDYIMG